MEKLSLEERIATANSWGLIGMLLDRLVENFEAAIYSIEDKHYDRVEKLNNHSRAILTELLVQFNGEDQLSHNLREINLYLNKLMTEGEIRKDPSIYKTCIKIVNPLTEGFKELELNEEPRTVAGLTYGKDSLDDYVLKSDRGFEV